jgi:hypothetical protein
VHELTPLDWILAGIAIASWFGGLWLYISPGVRRNAAVADAILGEAEVTDRSGKTIQPARPGLVHLQRDNSQRLTNVEEAVVEFRHAIGVYTEVLKRLDTAESDIALLKNTNVKDIVQAAERAATAAVSAEMLRLVNERDTRDGDAHEADELG